MKLADCDNQELFRGTVFRFQGKYPFCEEYVDFMLCVYPGCSEKCIPFALYCISGYHAGHLEYVFPSDAAAEKSNGISTKWIIENWSKKIYDGCDINDVEVII